MREMSEISEDSYGVNAFDVQMSASSRKGVIWTSLSSPGPEPPNLSESHWGS
jgi:hypothetical protein